ncbi:MAG: signal peptidase I [Smithella sp.]
MGKENSKVTKKPKSKIQEYIEAIIIAVIIAVFIRTFIVQAYKIPSRSMVPTLLVGDHLLVNKFIYGVKIPYFRKTIIPLTNPKRGDIVVFIYPNDRSKDFIKRVIGIEGDTIEIKNKKIFLNGMEYTDQFGIYSDNTIYPGTVQPRDNFGPVNVPPNSLFVMGDNRDESADSRYWGFVDLKDVEGKAFIIYWSWNREDQNLRWRRIGTLLR